MVAVKAVHWVDGWVGHLVVCLVPWMAENSADCQAVLWVYSSVECLAALRAAQSADNWVVCWAGGWVDSSAESLAGGLVDLMVAC